MSIFDNAFNEFFTRVQTAWPDVATNGMDSRTAAYMNWRELVSLGESNPGFGLATPWLVVDMGQMDPADGYGDANDVWKVPCKVYYVASLIGSGGVQRTSLQIDSLLSDKAELFRSTVLHASPQPTNFQIIDNVRMDYSVKNQLNQFFASRSWNFASLEVSCVLLIGVSSEV